MLKPHKSPQLVNFLPSPHPNISVLLCLFSKTASRFRFLSKPAFSIVKSTLNKPTLKPKTLYPLLPARSSTTFSRPISQLGCLQSLLPLHSAVSSARLTSCLGIDSRSSSSLSQELGLSVP
ncbi:protein NONRESPONDING TO OXYLIPINS 2, mitochondrial-like [Hibiscus syriacus]|uniref:protein NONRESPONDING TO OXYLIPINS 2, mitochondrial-like n=1 Tax=Hibiscus syriacus TaxID=106335 RepID=UPI0019238300|nr:protein NONRESPONDING TO OXYLIPINS 2, mitochondrial-like [Hibiscus syriacus]